MENDGSGREGPGEVECAVGVGWGAGELSMGMETKTEG